LGKITKERNRGTYVAENRFRDGEKAEGGSVEQQIENGFRGFFDGSVLVRAVKMQIS